MAVARSSAVLALAKQAQIAWSRSSLSPCQAGMMVSGAIRASWPVLMSSSLAGSVGLAGIRVPVGARLHCRCQPAEPLLEDRDVGRIVGAAAVEHIDLRN